MSLPLRATYTLSLRATNSCIHEPNVNQYPQRHDSYSMATQFMAALPPTCGAPAFDPKLPLTRTCARYYVGSGKRRPAHRAESQSSNPFVKCNCVFKTALKVCAGLFVVTNPLGVKKDC
ncbi:hypothetical protein PPTG_22783 [Phytophthora nicotianae INRA-310]|uniref:Uncharacterized protein n=1 Tax=Phytophthora nicotianae (strain INRA-310) TaxID=761204 RepID=W2QCP3_PHYN3|nr:hypothetical protein PPTG_22783 [Phytophthora nicotianae INRA-310]ETN10050.1 hypothetical protein PPTG_22783 [Phytophthora nicotianae INRA-310]